MAAPLRLLHLHSTFLPGGKEARAARLMNAFGPAASHVVVSAVPGALAARDLIAPDIAVDYPADHPPLAGPPSVARLRALARFMRGFDLVLSYNWGAMDGVMARRLFARADRLPPLVHHEDGFNEDEVARLKRSRNLYRRLALPGAARLVVPSRRLEVIAHTVWRQPAARIALIANGIALDRFGSVPAPDAIPGFTRRPGRVTVGTVAGLRAVKNLPRLVRAVAAAGPDIDLVIVGEGPARAAIAAEAMRLGLADRLTMPGHLSDPARYIGLFDIFALASDSEQQPVALIEAMAASLPAAATLVGDVAAMVAPGNRRFLANAGDEAGLARAIRALADDPALRAGIGAANRARACENFHEATMIARYRALYGAVIGREMPAI